MDQHKSSKSHTIRLPLNVWEEIKAQAETTDRSFNRVVLRMLQKQIEQEKQKEQVKKG